MINPDNMNIELSLWYDHEGCALLKEYTEWLKGRNIKYSLVREPLWSPEPTAINMRKEDALMFKLVFGL